MMYARERQQAVGRRVDSALDCELRDILRALQHVWTKGYRCIVDGERR